MQLLRKIGSSQVKPRSLKLLQQRIEDNTEHIYGLHICFLSSTEGYTGLFSKNIKKLFYEL